jgi:hypothetical protein
MLTLFDGGVSKASALRLSESRESFTSKSSRIFGYNSFVMFCMPTIASEAHSRASPRGAGDAAGHTPAPPAAGKWTCLPQFSNPNCG